MKIGIAGAGGLGSNVAVNLVRSGVDEIKIADFDVIEQSNLNRQFYFKDQIGQNKVNALFENLKRINPQIKLQIIQRKLERENLKEIFSQNSEEVSFVLIDFLA
jgi:sulfur carrier protein ThiS adenylyltransferase